MAAVVGFRRSATAAPRCVVCVAGRRCLCDMVSSMTSAAPIPCAPLSPPRVRHARSPRLGAAAQRARRVLTTRLGVVRVCGRSRSAACRALAAAAASCPDPRAAGFRCSDANADGAQSRSRTQCARDCARCRTRRLVFSARSVRYVSGVRPLRAGAGSIERCYRDPPVPL